MSNLKPDAAREDAQALFERSQQCFADGDLEQMVANLQQAADAGLAAAEDALGYVYEKGFGAEKDLQRARALYLRAAEQNHAQAQHRLAESLFVGDGQQYQPDAALPWYIRSAQQGFPAACRTLGLLYGQAHSQEYARSALHWFYRGAQLGDACCQFALGWRLMHGQGLPQDPATARSYLQHAMQAAYPCAKSTLMTLLRIGIKQSSQVNMEATCALTDPHPIELPDPSSIAAQWETLWPSPRIECCPGFLNAETASYIIDVGTPRLKPSEVIGTLKDGTTTRSQIRTSSSAFFPADLVDSVVRNVERRLCRYLKKPLCESEPCNLLHYSPGQEYQHHYDYFDPRVPTAPALMKCGGQRNMSVVMNLRDVAGGGETDFPKLPLRVPPRQGDALLFHNCDVQGNPDPRSLHAGLPVTSGEKCVLVKWYRERPTRYRAV